MTASFLLASAACASARVPILPLVPLAIDVRNALRTLTATRFHSAATAGLATIVRFSCDHTVALLLALSACLPEHILARCPDRPFAELAVRDLRDRRIFTRFYDHKVVFTGGATGCRHGVYLPVSKPVTVGACGIDVLRVRAVHRRKSALCLLRDRLIAATFACPNFQRDGTCPCVLLVRTADSPLDPFRHIAMLDLSSNTSGGIEWACLNLI
mmetsp:Transcript_21740/g.39919  ORF Transcript_21740/g.39919 Transcript_21740/m.39919 type:complete len:213 (-) Transcript_21740:3122-3760(-)